MFVQSTKCCFHETVSDSRCLDKRVEQIEMAYNMVCWTLAKLRLNIQPLYSSIIFSVCKSNFISIRALAFISRETKKGTHYESRLTLWFYVYLLYYFKCSYTKMVLTDKSCFLSLLFIVQCKRVYWQQS